VEVDLDAADPSDALDSRKFRLAFLQRAMGPVAFARNIFQMLQQPFRSRGLRKRIGLIGSGHTCL
jgi:hypothetical protein